MSWLSKFTAVAAALAMVVGAAQASPPPSPAATARLTEAHGEIFKRGFVDWTKDEWGDPQRAQVGDLLHEGMQLGTGNKSWAQVAWPNVTTRAWSNTVFAIAPHQKLVYLIDGEMLFNLAKNRKDKREYVVWTKVLQARIRGTTVLVQAGKDVSRITVLEGCVDVMNRLDRSVIRVTPGVVYEIRTPDNNPGMHGHLHHPQLMGIDRPHVRNQRPGDPLFDRLDFLPGNIWPPLNNGPTGEGTQEGGEGGGDRILPPLPVPGDLGLLEGNDGILDPLAGTASSAPSAISQGASTLTNIIADNKGPLKVFETTRSSTNLYTVDTVSLGEHPLVKEFTQPLPSLPLVQASLSGLHDLAGQAGAPAAVTPVDKLVSDNAQIVRVPTAVNYKVGPEIGKDLPVPPQAFTHWAPVGFIGQPAVVTDSASGTEETLKAGQFAQGRARPGFEPVAGRPDMQPKLPGAMHKAGPLTNAGQLPTAGALPPTSFQQANFSPGGTTTLAAPLTNTGSLSGSPLTTPTNPVPTLPGGTLLGGTLPGTSLPGGTIIDRTVQGGQLPGSTLPGATLPGGGLPLPGTMLPPLPFGH